MSNRFLCVCTAACLLVATFAFAEGTQTWRQTKFEDFEKGTAKGVAVRSDGSLELAPSFRSLYTTPSAYLWAITSDADGNAYAAAGSPARVYRITPDGKASVIFEPQELQVQALIGDGKDGLFAATSPDGKVYHVVPKETAASQPAKKGQKKAAAPLAEPAQNEAETPAGVDSKYTSSVFFDPRTKYIWDLALGKDGSLYVATGDHGELYKVDRDGKGSVFFKSDEAHIRVLRIDSKGNVIAGSDGSGLIYRISPAGEAFVLYSTPKKEIMALALDDKGNIYAAGGGEKQHAQVAGASSSLNVAGSGGAIGNLGGSPAVAASSASAGPSGGSEIYMITPEGAPRRLWSSTTDLVYALGFDSRGRLLAGTGNRGHIYAIRMDDSFTDLLTVSANQVTSFAKAPKGGLYVASSNLGKVALLGSAADADGAYESDVYDAKIFSRWGRVEVRGQGNFDLYARSGNVDNPDRNWSSWSKIDLQKNAELNVPMARFVQWRAVLHPGSVTPMVDDVALNYRANNVAPEIDDITVQVGARFQPMPKPAQDATPVMIGGPAQPPTPKIDTPMPAMHDRDSIAVKWGVHDDNDDQLVYSIYYRGEGETRWKLLKDKLTDKFYSWDAGLLPDGAYTVKVIASDAPSHTPDQALADEKESSRFEVDHTPPQVQDLVAHNEAGTVHVTFRGNDNFSPLKRAEYSIDAQDWQFVEPVGQLSDSKVENYDFAIPVPSTKPADLTDAAGASRGGDGGTTAAVTPAEHVIVVRIYDRYDNMGTAKVVFKTP
jgi:hypothetical protein